MGVDLVRVSALSQVLRTINRNGSYGHVACQRSHPHCLQDIRQIDWHLALLAGTQHHMHSPYAPVLAVLTYSRTGPRKLSSSKVHAGHLLVLRSVVNTPPSFGSYLSEAIKGRPTSNLNIELRLGVRGIHRA